MPFSTDSTRKRRIAIEREEQLAARKAAAQEAHEAERHQFRERMEHEYPSIPVNDAVELWTIAVKLTDELVKQYEAGLVTIKATTDVWSRLFLHERLNSYVRLEQSSKGYLPTLHIMAQAYNSIDQTFALRALPRLTHRDPRVRVTATVNLKDDEDSPATD